MPSLSKTRVLALLLVVGAMATGCGDGDGGGGGIEPEVSLDPDSGPPGTEVAVSVSGCASQPNGTLLDSASSEVAGVAFTDSETGTVTVPDGTAAGSYRLSVSCQTQTEETEEGTVTTFADADASFEVTG